jgi:hypothetical protein
MVYTCTISPLSNALLVLQVGHFYLDDTMPNIENDNSLLADCSDVLRSIPLPQTQDMADMLDVLDDDNASTIEKATAVLDWWF